MKNSALLAVALAAAVLKTMRTIKRPPILLPCFVFAAGLFTNTALATIATNNVTVGINAADQGAVIPANFVGLSYSRSYISGAGGQTRIFDQSRQTNEVQLTNLLAEIGVKHIRTICGPFSNATLPPTPAEDDNFFAFCADSGVTSVIYSLSCYNEPRGATDDVTSAIHIWTNSADRSLLESFAMDNEPDWLGSIGFGGSDTTVSNYWSYRQRWLGVYTNIYTNLQAVAPGRVPFSGPDTGCSWPLFQPYNDSVTNDPGHDDPDGTDSGTPFTLQFVNDQSVLTNFVSGNQHFYNSGGSPAPNWVQGVTYYRYDQAMDTNVTFGTKTPIAYVMTNQHTLYNDAVPPDQDTGTGSNWEQYTPFWSSTAEYNQYDIVAEDNNGDFYQYTNTTPNYQNTLEPSQDTANWWQVKDPSGPSAKQMAVFELATNRLVDWNTLFSNDLQGTNKDLPGGPEGHWPTNSEGVLWPYRLTEFSAYDNGGGVDNGADSLDVHLGNPNGQIFATALWELDACHWLARHGCSGVDPFAYRSNHSSPIFYDSTNNCYYAEPYAYGLKAFSLGSAGTCVNNNGVTNPASTNMTAYAVVGPHDLYVTLINKTFPTVGAYAENVTINPSGFNATSASYYLLTSGDNGPFGQGSATILAQAELGGAIITNSGNWMGTPTTLTVHSDNTCTVLVPACTAAIVDIKNN